ncbi:hypothetical protein AWM68_17550 [Fictibacillus phosphorivorans]|uniref:Uncharacterized protein n=1 Tax=Fictibacillus phosphorivorans TaxID=1221500 RepID=A0A163S1U7_9BACL|nr:hypothetical protein [Fictibacillus phosphorivorans]KZE67977.1 hypothetical protein AWM68_17550 [Fictibacillus phosphorivorans]
MKKNYPKWIFKTKGEVTAAFRNLQCINGFPIAVRVGLDGATVFGKNDLSPNLHYMNKEEFACLEDFIGKGRKGIKAFEVGCIRLDGSLWFSDCMYEPGLIEEDFNDLKSLLFNFYVNHLPTEKQTNRIKRLVEHVGEDRVKDYFLSKFPDGDFKNMNRQQAQKVITGLQLLEPRKPIYNVYADPQWLYS